MSSNFKLLRTCIYCGSEFQAQTRFTKYCSHKCNQKHYKERKRKELLREETADELKSTALSEDVKLSEKEILSISEACRFLGVSRTTLWRLTKEGTLKRTRLKNRVVFMKSEIELTIKYFSK